MLVPFGAAMSSPLWAWSRIASWLPKREVILPATGRLAKSTPSKVWALFHSSSSTSSLTKSWVVTLASIYSVSCSALFSVYTSTMPTLDVYSSSYFSLISSTNASAISSVSTYSVVSPSKVSAYIR